MHYNPSSIKLTKEEQTSIGNPNYHDSQVFNEMINKAIKNYLSDENYDPLKVICAIRVRVEELVYNKLSTNEEKKEYVKIHTTIKKLFYAMERGVELSEVLFLLQPLYNDGLHINDNDYTTKNKIQSTCLKLDNNIVKHIVGKLFS